MKRAIIFDMDDTLYPESSYVFSGFRAVAEFLHENIGIPQAEAFDGLVVLFERGVRGNTFNEWISARDLDPDLLNPMIAAYRDHFPTITVFEGCRDMLRSVACDFKIGLISDGYLSVQQRKFAALKLDQFFDDVLFSDSLGREHWKPSVLPFENVLSTLQVAPELTIYVGDNPEKDFKAPRVLGMRSIRIRHANGVYAKCEPASPEFEPDFEVRGFDELHDVLEEFCRSD